MAVGRAKGVCALIYAVEIGGESYTVETREQGSDEELHYKITGPASSSGSASIAQIKPGKFSVLLRTRSFTIDLIQTADGLQAWFGQRTLPLSIADPRDKSPRNRKIEAEGAVELRAPMPGKVLKLLTAAGEHVEAGQGVVVIEAMKMQNELKAPKSGTVKRINAGEGATVTAGQTLVTIE
jgi:biotin carboxyl carrier protein